MPELEKNAPPAGEEVHLPGGSIQPLLLTIGLTMALIGVTFNVVLVIGGSILSVWVIIRWIADSRRDIDALPSSHGDGH
jgi:hypothetical protein